MSKAQVIHKFGPPEVMQWQELLISDPGIDEVSYSFGTEMFIQ